MGIVVGHTTCDKCGAEAESFIPGHEVIRLDVQLADSTDKVLRLEARISKLTSERDEWRFRAETAEACVSQLCVVLTLHGITDSAEAAREILGGVDQPQQEAKRCKSD